jgi:hypothetical protein
MSSLSISRAWDETKSVIAHDGRLIAAVALALILLPQAIVGVIAPPPTLSGEEPASWVSLLNLLVALFGIAGQIAIIRLAIGPTTTVGEAISHGLRRLLPGFAALLLFVIPLVVLLVILLIAIGGPDAMQSLINGTKSAPEPRQAAAILLFVVFAILISVRFQLTIPVAAAENGGPIALLRRSWALTAGHYWRLLAVLLLVFAAAIVLLLFAQIVGGILARLIFGDVKPFTVGALIVALISAAAQTVFAATFSVLLARIYVQLSGRDTASVPKSGI